jgi:hypothetical protein
MSRSKVALPTKRAQAKPAKKPCLLWNPEQCAPVSQNPGFYEEKNNKASMDYEFAIRKKNLDVTPYNLVCCLQARTDENNDENEGDDEDLFLQNELHQTDFEKYQTQDVESIGFAILKQGQVTYCTKHLVADHIEIQKLFDEANSIWLHDADEFYGYLRCSPHEESWHPFPQGKEIPIKTDDGKLDAKKHPFEPFCVQSVEPTCRAFVNEKGELEWDLKHMEFARGKAAERCKQSSHLNDQVDASEASSLLESQPFIGHKTRKQGYFTSQEMVHWMFKTFSLFGAAINHTEASAWKAPTMEHLIQSQSWWISFPSSRTPQEQSKGGDLYYRARKSLQDQKDQKKCLMWKYCADLIDLYAVISTGLQKLTFDDIRWVKTASGKKKAEPYKAVVSFTPFEHTNNVICTCPTKKPKS